MLVEEQCRPEWAKMMTAYGPPRASYLTTSISLACIVWSSPPSNSTPTDAIVTWPLTSFTTMSCSHSFGETIQTIPASSPNPSLPSVDTSPPHSRPSPTPNQFSLLLTPSSWSLLSLSPQSDYLVRQEQKTSPHPWRRKHQPHPRTLSKWTATLEPAISLSNPSQKLSSFLIRDQ